MRTQVKKISLVRAFIPSHGNLMIWANALCMLVGLFLLDWRPEAMVLAYFTETIIVGLLHTVKMVVIWRYSYAERIAADTTVHQHGYSAKGGKAILFFMFHYFFFVFVQSIFVFAFVGMEFPEIEKPFYIIQNYAWVFSQPDVQHAFAVLAFMHIVQRIFDYYLPRKFHKQILRKVYIQPYLRVVVQQFMVILAGFFVFSSQMMASAVLLIILRFVVDIFFRAASNNPAFKKKLITKLVKNIEDIAEAKRAKEELTVFFED